MPLLLPLHTIDGLRDYKTEPVVWGDDPSCPHHWPGYEALWEGDVCRICNAGRVQLGLEGSVDCLGWAKGEWCNRCFICHLVEVFRAVKRVLREDGTAWVVIGDGFVHDRSYQVPDNKVGDVGNHMPRNMRDQSIGSHNLILTPFRLALALQADGWLVRADVVWGKLNGLPESVDSWRWVQHRAKTEKGRIARHGLARGEGYVNESNVAEREAGTKWEDCPGCPKCTDTNGLVLRKGSWRPSRSHEYILMLAKSPQYYADREAVKQVLAVSSVERLEQPGFDEQEGGPGDYRDEGSGINANRSARDSLEHLKVKYVRGKPSGNPDGTGRNLRDVWAIGSRPFNLHLCLACEKVYSITELRKQPKGENGKPVCFCGANNWMKHFALFPVDIPVLCIEASTPEVGVCEGCGAHWARVVAQGQPTEHPGRIGRSVRNVGDFDGEGYAHRASGLGLVSSVRTQAWRPTCQCIESQPVPALVLDPFMGAGTTLLAALELGRRGIGVDVNTAYCKLAAGRLEKEMQKMNTGAVT